MQKHRAWAGVAHGELEQRGSWRGWPCYEEREGSLSSLLGQDLATGVIPGPKKARGRGEGRAGKEEDSWGKRPREMAQWKRK